MSPQRLRITYRSDAPTEQRGNFARLWVDAIEAAGLLVARADGGRRAHVEFGPALPEGVSGNCELLDIWLDRPAEPAEVCARLREALLPGLVPVDVEDIGERLPSFAASVVAYRYRAVFAAGSVDGAALHARTVWFSEQPSFQCEELRGERLRVLDLKQIIREVAATTIDGALQVDMCLAVNQQQTARPATVLDALELPAQPVSLVRTAIEVLRPRVALAAWRERGRFA